MKCDVKYVGVNDHQVDLFEGQYDVPNGMSYNSYVIVDEKIAVMDSVDKNFGLEWINNICQVLGERKPDYLIIQHMEPDHSASIPLFMEKFPDATIVSSSKAFQMMKQFFGTDFNVRQLVVKEGDKLILGKHVLNFVGAPMVHWPEVIVTYDSYSKVLFSADGFGKFGALDVEEDWACEARRYYFGIVSKYGLPVQTLLKKASSLDIEAIYPLHGPMLEENLGYYLEKYNIWSSYQPEDKGIVIAYSTVYGNTRSAVELLADKLISKGHKVSVIDLARCDIHEAIEDAFRYDTLVLASITYNGDIFPHMKEFINSLVERGYQNRRIALIENGSWAPSANKVMKNMLINLKNIEYILPEVRISSALDNSSKKVLEELVESL